MQHKVKCPQCGANEYFETTEEYDPDVFAHPMMLAWQSPYDSYNWDGLVSDRSAGYGGIECPQCGAQMAPSGKLTVPEYVREVFRCDVCDKEFKSKGGLAGHYRSKEHIAASQTEGEADE